ncbi:MAG: hypothetical protein QOJ31_158 [Gaiellales bacterium]|jgi:hypothetical protein|nr:hypothetical protein [Gaiellales bacterium]
MTPQPAWITCWIDATLGQLTVEEVDFLREIERFVPNAACWWHEDSRFERLALEGPADDPQLVTYFRAERRRPGLLLAFEWSLRHDDLDYGVWLGHIFEVVDEAGCRLPSIVGADGVARR